LAWHFPQWLMAWTVSHAATWQRLQNPPRHWASYSHPTPSANVPFGVHSSGASAIHEVQLWAIIAVAHARSEFGALDVPGAANCCGHAGIFRVLQLSTLS
jgi:hypothetical protein